MIIFVKNIQKTFCQLIQFYNLNLQQQFIMKQTNLSLNLISERDHAPKSKEQQYEALPPQIKTQINLGLFTFRININYLNARCENLALRCNLWGRQNSDYLYFKSEQEKKTCFILNFNLRTDIQKLTKYFYDMKLLCIQVVSIIQMTQKQMKNFGRIKNCKHFDYKILGCIYLNTRRYIINHLLSEFEEKTSIIDQNKQKIGQIIIQANYKFYEKKKKFFSQKLPNLEPSQCESQKELIKERRQVIQNIRSKNIQNQQKSNISKQPSQNFQQNYHDYDHNFNSKRGTNQTNKYLKQQIFTMERRKGKAQLFLEEYLKNKPEHTQLSLIKDKYGFNNPSIQLMKLKMDEVQLLDKIKSNQIEDLPLNKQSFSILLKHIQSQSSKVKLNELCITYQNSKTTLKTETKIILPDTTTNKTHINYLYTIPQIDNQDLITFQTKDCKTDIKVGQLRQRQKLILKFKSNLKKGIELEYSVINLIQQTKFDGKPNIQNKMKIQKNKENDIGYQDIQKKSIYVKVQNWPEDKIIIKNVQIGIINSCKATFDLIHFHQNKKVTFELSDNKNTYILEEILSDTLYKQSNMLIGGNQIKIITSVGKLEEILQIVQSKSNQHKIKQETRQNHLKQTKDQQKNYLNETVNFFILLQNCQNQNCKQLIDQLLHKDAVLSESKIQKLSKLVNIDLGNVQLIFQVIFKYNFHFFYQCFQVFHEWNHKYKKSQQKIRMLIHQNHNLQNQASFYSLLKKILKKLKQSSKIMFGLINAQYLSSQLKKIFQEKNQYDFIEEEEDENLKEENLSYQDYIQLVSFIFDRYYFRNIKISEIESFFTNKDTTFSLNYYLINKISQQIAMQQILRDQISKKQHNFFKLFEKHLQQQLSEKHHGLAKLLMKNETYEIQADQSQLVTEEVQLINKKYTTQGLNQEQRQQTIYPTEKSHQKINIEPQNQYAAVIERNIESNQSIGNTQQKSIQLFIMKIEIESIATIKRIRLSNQRQNRIIYEQTEIFKQQYLPIKLDLRNKQANSITIETNFQIHEGIFIASLNLNKIKLYANGNQSGLLLTKIQTPLDQSEIKLQYKNKVVIKNDVESSRQRIKNDDDQIQIVKRPIVPVAKSPNIKMIITSIKPTKSKYSIKIFNKKNSKYYNFNYPEETQLILENNDIFIFIMESLINPLEKIEISNQLCLNSYSICNLQNNKIDCIVNIEIQQFWGSLEVRQNKNIKKYKILHLESLISLQPLSLGQYQLLVQTSKDIVPLKTIHIQFQNRQIHLESQLQLDNSQYQWRIKIINRSKELVCDFHFQLNANEDSVVHQKKYLIYFPQQSEHCSNSFRLLTDYYQIRYQDNNGSKMENIFKIFNFKHKQAVAQWIRETGLSNIKQSNFILFLKSKLKLTLIEIDILFEELLPNQDGKSYTKLLDFFLLSKFENKMEYNLLQLYKELNIFDLNNNGIITFSKFNIIKRMINKNFLEISELFKQQNKGWNLSLPLKYVIDLNIINRSEQYQIDYLTLLHELKNNVFDDFFFLSNGNSSQKQQNYQKSLKKQILIEKDRYFRIKLIEFQKLSVSNSPSTLLFKINGQKLAEPIPRCFSYKYNSYPEITIKANSELYFQIYQKKINSKGEVQFSFVEKVKLTQKIHALGGKITLQIMSLEDNYELNNNKPINLEQLKKLKREFYEQKQDQQNNDLSNKVELKNSQSIRNQKFNESKKKWQKQYTAKKQLLSSDAFLKSKKIEEISLINRNQLDAKFNNIDSD